MPQSHHGMNTTLFYKFDRCVCDIINTGYLYNVHECIYMYVYNYLNFIQIILCVILPNTVFLMHGTQSKLPNKEQR